jgi:hypothetical protein
MGSGYSSPWSMWWHKPWEYKLMFAWLPRRLDSTGKYVWLKQVYMGRREIHGPGTPVVLYKYLTPEEYTWEMLVDHAQTR